MKFEYSHRFPATPGDVVARILDTEFQQRLYQELGYQHWSEERYQGPGTMERLVRIVPASTVPPFIRGVMGENNGYRETQYWEADLRSYRWRVELDMSERAVFTGECRFEPDGDGCRRTVIADLVVRFPVMAGKVEAFLKEDTIETQDRMVQHMIAMMRAQAAV